ncbi:glycosyltransferase family 2 protein [Ventrimonas sp. CLA-AP-H27]|uniref:Glycosyltransferase family 2 protein n=1 Tax=Ventrimonas faecis TaxID=3133170 RepID=A0ABV1HNG6_9FIRM
MKNIKVSIICITYNQAEYIKDAINSFLMQKTKFDYEIIVHDDASTDQTIQIIKQYESKYPEKIRAIYEEENQYSKGVNISDVLFKIAKGKYLAFCEGDDFWTDQYKLQKQYDYMEQHDDCMAYVHNGWKIEKDKRVVYNSRALSVEAKKYGIEDAICGLGIQTYTNSFFMRAKVFENRPNFLQYAPTRDYVMLVECAMHGYIYYSPEKMSAQRVTANSSLSQIWGQNPALRKEYIDKQMILLDKINEDTAYKYARVIEKEKTNQMFSNILARKDKSELKQEPYRTLLRNMSVKRKLQYYSPVLFRALSKISRVIRNEKRNFEMNVHYEEF